MSWAHNASLIMGLALGALGLGMVMVGLTTAGPPSPASPAAEQIARLSVPTVDSEEDHRSTCDCGRSHPQSSRLSAERLASLPVEREPSGHSTDAGDALRGGVRLGVAGVWANAAVYEDARGRVQTPPAFLRSFAAPTRTVPNDRMLRVQWMGAADRRLANGDEPERLATPAWMDSKVTILAPPR